MNSRNRWDWIETVAKLAGNLGFNSVKVRWKLTRWRDSTKNKSQATVDTISHVGYAHRLCSNCGRVQDRSAKVCPNCGQKFSHRSLEILSRIGLVTPHLASVNSILMVAIVACYLRTVSASGGLESIVQIDWRVLLGFGGDYPPYVLAGEWWRLGTSIFLHAGIMHLLFNLFALAEIGTEIEEIFGRGRLLFFFMFTGIVASAFSLVWRHYLANSGGVGVGASGAIMGLIGVAAAWGHKDGTTIGRSIRDMMLKWLAYTMVFGFFIGADNAAHIGGFVCGGAIGWFAQPKTRKRSVVISWSLTFVGALLATICVLLVLFSHSRYELF